MHHDSSHDTPQPITTIEQGTGTAPAKGATLPPSDMPVMPQDKLREALRRELQDLDVSQRPEIRPTHRAVALALRIGGPTLAEKLIVGKYGGDLWRTLWGETLLFGSSTFSVDELTEWATALHFVGSSAPASHVVRMIRDAAAVRLLLSGHEAEKLARHLAHKVSPVIC